MIRIPYEKQPKEIVDAGHEAFYIFVGMALGLFASAYADQATDAGISLTGEIMDQLPALIDDAAVEAARTLYKDMEDQNGMPMPLIFQRFGGDFAPVTKRRKVDGVMKNVQERAPDPQAWGHYAAMQAQGHGTGLWDHGVEKNAIIIPRLDWHADSLKRNYHAR